MIQYGKKILGSFLYFGEIIDDRNIKFLKRIHYDGFSTVKIAQKCDIFNHRKFLAIYIATYIAIQSVLIHTSMAGIVMKQEDKRLPNPMQTAPHCFLSPFWLKHTNNVCLLHAELHACTLVYIHHHYISGTKLFVGQILSG